MATPKEIINKLVDEIPETKIGEVIDFLLYLRDKKEQELYLDSEEEKALWTMINSEERVTSEKVNELLVHE